MATNVTSVRKSEVKLVYLGTEVPDECIANAQVVIRTESTWHVIAPNPYRMHCTTDVSMPKVKCAVVDISGVKDEDTMRAVMEKCVDKSAGVINLAGLLTGLEALGGKVTPAKPDAVDVNAAWRARKEGQVAKKMRAIVKYEATKRVVRRVRAQRKEKVH